MPLRAKAIMIDSMCLTTIPSQVVFWSLSFSFLSGLLLRRSLCKLIELARESVSSSWSLESFPCTFARLNCTQGKAFKDRGRSVLSLKAKHLLSAHLAALGSGLPKEERPLLFLWSIHPPQLHDLPMFRSCRYETC